MLTQQDLQQLAQKGITPEQINIQLDEFKTGFPFLRLEAAAAVGKGIVGIFVLTALGYLPLVFSSSYPAVIANAMITGLPLPLFGALCNGFVFSKTPVERQGRTRAAVMTTIMLFGSGSGAVAGELLPRIGFSGVVLVMMALLGISIALVVLNQRIRTIPASPDWPEVEL